MLAIFSEGIVSLPNELHSPCSSNKNPKFPEEIVKDFNTSQPGLSALSVRFENSALLSYFPSGGPMLHHGSLFCSMDDIYCIFLGNLSNLSDQLRLYGLPKDTNEGVFVIEAYRTLRDRGPYPADQVLRDLDGSFGFVVYDRKAGVVFSASGVDERVQLFWGIAADGSAVISDNMDIIKASCGKSFAPFPVGCMFHSELGLMNFEHPKNKLKAIPRIDSEGMMCGANFEVDISFKTSSMPRVGSEANWALSDVFN